MSNETLAVTIHGWPDHETWRTAADVIQSMLTSSTSYATTVQPIDDAPLVLDLFQRISDLTTGLAATAAREHRAVTELVAANNEQAALRTELDIAQQDVAALRIKVTTKDQAIGLANNKMHSLLNELHEWLSEEGYDQDNDFVQHLIDDYGMSPMTHTIEGEFKVTYTVTYSIEDVPMSVSYDDIDFSMDIDVPNLHFSDVHFTVQGHSLEAVIERAYGGDAEVDDWQER